MLNGLHALLTFDGRVVRNATPRHDVVRKDVRELLLLPCAFAAPSVLALVDRVVLPAEGVTSLCLTRRSAPAAA